MVDYIPIPEKYRKSPEVTTNIDFLDTITGISYKVFYLAGATSSAGNTYFLTTNSSISSDQENYQVIGNAADVDFDIEVGVGFTVAAEEAIVISSQKAPNGQTQAVTWKVRHVTSGAAETDLGTTIGDTITGGVADEWFIKTTKITLTEKRFNKGEKLRINFVTASGAGGLINFDPSGVRSQTSEVPNYNHDTRVLIPIKIDA